MVCQDVSEYLQKDSSDKTKEGDDMMILKAKYALRQRAAGLMEMTLPGTWVEAKKIHPGDTLYVYEDDKGRLTISKDRLSEEEQTA